MCDGVVRWRAPERAGQLGSAVLVVGRGRVPEGGELGEHGGARCRARIAGRGGGLCPGLCQRHARPAEAAPRRRAVRRRPASESRPSWSRWIYAPAKAADVAAADLGADVLRADVGGLILGTRAYGLVGPGGSGVGTGLGTSNREGATLQPGGELCRLLFGCIVRRRPQHLRIATDESGLGCVALLAHLDAYGRRSAVTATELRAGSWGRPYAGMPLDRSYTGGLWDESVGCAV